MSEGGEVKGIAPAEAFSLPDERGHESQNTAGSTVAALVAAGGYAAELRIPRGAVFRPLKDKPWEDRPPGRPLSIPIDGRPFEDAPSERTAVLIHPRFITNSSTIHRPLLYSSERS